LRAVEPAKITSVMFSLRRRLAALSPSTQRTASMMLDLPLPLGPTTQVMLVGSDSVVGSTKDLKPASLIEVRRMRVQESGERRAARCGQARDCSQWAHACATRQDSNQACKVRATC